MYNPIPVYSIYFVIFYNLNTETCYPYICIVHIHKLLYFLSHITQQQMDPISRGLEANRRGGTQSRSSGHQVTKATLGFSTHLLVLIHFEQIRKCFKGCQQSLTLSFGFWCWDLEVMPPCPLGLQCYRHGQGMKGVDGLPCHHIQGCVHGMCSICEWHVSTYLSQCSSVIIGTYCSEGSRIGESILQPRPDPTWIACQIWCRPCRRMGLAASITPFGKATRFQPPTWGFLWLKHTINADLYIIEFVVRFELYSL